MGLAGLRLEADGAHEQLVRVGIRPLGEQREARSVRDPPHVLEPEVPQRPQGRADDQEGVPQPHGPRYPEDEVGEEGKHGRAREGEQGAPRAREHDGPDEIRPHRLEQAFKRGGASQGGVHAPLGRRRGRGRRRARVGRGAFRHGEN